MKSVQREWDWWAYHYRVVHRTQIPGISQWDDDLVDLIVEVLGLRQGELFALNNLALTLQRLGRHDEALAGYERLAARARELGSAGLGAWQLWRSRG